MFEDNFYENPEDFADINQAMKNSDDPNDKIRDAVDNFNNIKMLIDEFR